MADKASDGLPYGQFGRAIFDADNTGWNFGRKTQSPHLLRPVGKANLITKPAANTDQFYPRRSDGKDPPSRRREKQTKTLVQSIPELQPVSDILPELARVSEAAEHANSQHDTSVGTLIARGEVYDESRRDYVGAVAFPSGPTGSDLRIVQGLKQRQGWDEDGTSWIDTLDFSGEEGTWQGPGVSILSIVFAQPLEQGEHYLAVRLQTETLVFRPVLRKHAGSGSSKLDPNPLFSVSIDDTGGHPHMDVAFNPWFTGQLALVDQTGSWIVWETGRKSSKPKKINSGTLAGQATTKSKSSLDDGWARLRWAESTSTMCIALRSKLFLMDLEAADELARVEVDIGLKKELGWILDVGTLQAFLSNLFVLTSNHILVYRIERDNDGQILSKMLFQTRHHRSPEDVTLRMTLCADDHGVALFLRSALSPVVNQFSFDLSDSGLVHMHTPASFEKYALPNSSGILDCFLEQVPLIHKDADDLMYPLSAAILWHYYFLGKDMAVLRTLYASNVGHTQTEFAEAPTWVADITKPKRKSKPILAGFIANDEDQTAVTCRRPTSEFVMSRRKQKTAKSDDEWTVSYGRVVRMLNESNAEDRTDIDEITEEISALLESPTAQSKRPMLSLREVVDGSLEVENLEGASARLHGLHLIQTKRREVKTKDEDLDPSSQADNLIVVPLANSEARALLGLHGLDSLVEASQTVQQTLHWPSPTSAPRATLEARNGHGRRIVTELTLASRLLRVEDQKLEEAGGGESQSQPQAFDLPVRQFPAEGSSQDAKASDYDASARSQTPALPTPSASASTVTGSSHPSSFAAPEVARLSKYTTFSKDAPAALPRALNKVLSHWTVGADPAEYDWQSTARQVSRRGEEADDDDMTEKERRQMQRRTERYIRRQRREAEESQRQQMLSSQAPEIVSASQPAQRQGLRRAESQVSAGAAGAVMGSSQSYGPSQMVASQIVPGPHGGRPPPRKKRKSGF